LRQVVVVVEHVGSGGDLHGTEVLAGDGSDQIELRVGAGDHAESAAACTVAEQHEAGAARAQAEDVQQIIRHGDGGQDAGLVENTHFQAEVEEAEHHGAGGPDADDGVPGETGRAGARNGNAAGPKIELHAPRKTRADAREQQLVVADHDFAGLERERRRREHQALVGGTAVSGVAAAHLHQTRERLRGLLAGLGGERIGRPLVFPADVTDFAPAGGVKAALDYQAAGGGTRPTDAGESNPAAGARQGAFAEPSRTQRWTDRRDRFDHVETQRQVIAGMAGHIHRGEPGRRQRAQRPRRNLAAEAGVGGARRVWLCRRHGDHPRLRVASQAANPSLPHGPDSAPTNEKQRCSRGGEGPPHSSHPTI
jgi:hypothetical protein